MISLLILGVIASLTIPSLIQNTQKKEEQVKVKKGLSLLNQAFAMNYAITGEEPFYSDSPKFDDSEIFDIFKKRLSIVYGDSLSLFQTQDGINFSCSDSAEVDGAVEYNPSQPTSSSNYITDCNIITTPVNLDEDNGNYSYSLPPGEYNYEHVYMTYCGARDCVASDKTAKFISASNPSKCKYVGHVYTCE